MYSDIVFPKGNEKKFLEMAKRLGYSRLIFAYDSIKDIALKDIEKLKKDSGIDIKPGLKITKNTKTQKGIVAFARSSESDRNLIESAAVDFIYDLESSKRKDFMHHRNSGLNQVIAKIAKEKNVAFAFSFSSLLDSKGQKRAELIGRIKQNIMICNKYKVRILFASFAVSPFDMRSPNDFSEFMNIVGISDPKKSQFF